MCVVYQNCFNIRLEYQLSGRKKLESTAEWKSSHRHLDRNDRLKLPVMKHLISPRFTEHNEIRLHEVIQEVFKVLSADRTKDQ